MTPQQPRTLSRDPTAQTTHHPPDDRFIPVSAIDLLAALVAAESELGPHVRALPEFGAALRDVIDFEAVALERDVLELYADVNPDRDTAPTADALHRRATRGCDGLARQLDYLAQKANFDRLDTPHVAAVVRAANSHGLRVRLRPERIQRLAIWVRGRSNTRRQVRTIRHPFRGRGVTLPVYRRLVVMAQLRDDPHVLLKLFKDIPVEDVEALLPHAEVTMTWLDRLKAWGGGAGAIGSTAAKLLSTAATLAALSKLLWVLLLGLGTLAVRTILGYRRARLSRDWQRTRHLYYQNLSNNAGVVHTLVDMIAQEEFKEALLAYAFCGAPNDPPGSPADLRGRIEGFVGKRFEVRFDFDIDDALESLTRLDLWQSPDALRALPPQQAIERLRRHWREGRCRDYHRLAALDRTALAVAAPRTPPDVLPPTDGDMP